MAKSHGLTREAFDILLQWLDPEDRGRAGEKYESIRRSLIKIFTWRGLSDAEGLADETINRVANKVKALTESYTGDPALYFYAVAKNLVLEAWRAEHQQVDLAPAMSLAYETDWDDQIREVRNRAEARNRCFDSLPPDDQDLLRSYYRGKGVSKIDHRKALAEELGVEQVALRMRIYRLRLKLQRCFEHELARLHEE